MHRITSKQKRYLLISIITGAVIFTGGYLAGAQHSSSFAEGGKTDSKLLGDVKSILDSKFIPWKASNTPPTSQELEYGIIKGYVAAYKDPYTVFFPPSEAKSFADQVQGSFGGVGMQVGDKDGHVTIIAPLKDSPAMKAGILAGDIVATVNDTDVSNKSTDEVVNMIRGPIGTTVKIGVLHPGKLVVTQITITRQEIKIPTLDTETKDGVFVIHLYNFSAESIDLFKKAIGDFAKTSTPYLVLDLRGNPGGYLEAAVEMASYFLPEGKMVVSEKQGVTQEEIDHRSKGYNVFNKNLRMVILMDGGSASAAEILAGALHDQGIATIVGVKSFGKGSVQELINLDDGSSLKVTVAKWFTPNGTSISESGIKPDIESKLDIDLYQAKVKVDTQLNKAIQVVKTLPAQK